MDVEAEIRELRRRVGELEGGWGFLTTQVRAVHVDLLDFKDEMTKFRDRTEQRFDRLETDVTTIKHGLSSLRDDLPTIVGSAVREVLNERGGN